jgi:YHS domain-containing protein
METASFFSCPYSDVPLSLNKIIVYMKYLLLFCSAILLFSCQQNNAPKEQQAPAAAETQAPVAAVSNKLPDPVCEMPYDTSYKADTLHFCSATCKGVFEKAPEKYMAKLGK